MCRNGYAHTDGETAGCCAVLEGDQFGDTDIGSLMVWGQGVFGGPIVVLPEGTPPIVITDDGKWGSLDRGDVRWQGRAVCPTLLVVMPRRGSVVCYVDAVPRPPPRPCA